MIIKGEKGECVPMYLINSVTLESQCTAEYRTLSKTRRPDSIWLMQLPEQGIWLAFKWDPLWTVGELKEINPAESAGGEGVRSCETSPAAEQRHWVLMMRFKLQRLWEKRKGSRRHVKRLRAGRSSGGLCFGHSFGVTVGLVSKQGTGWRGGGRDGVSQRRRCM